MKRRILALFLALVLCPGMASVASAAEPTGWTVKEVTPTQYDDVDSDEYLRTAFREGLAAVKRGGKWGFIDVTGQEVIPCKYDSVGGGYDNGFSNGLAPVAIESGEKDKWGFIDKKGTEVVPYKYDEVKAFSEGLAAVRYQGNWGFIDETGNEIIPCQYTDVEGFLDGLSIVRQASGMGIIDKTGTEVIPCKYTWVHSFIHDLAVVMITSDETGEYGRRIYKYGFVNKDGQEVIPCIYENVSVFSEEGLAAVCVDGKYSFIDQTGKEVVPYKYDKAEAFSEGLAAVMVNGKWGFVDKTGAEVIPCKYDNAGYFSEGLAMVELDGKYGFIDKAGMTAIPFQYSSEEAYGWLDGFFDGVAVVGYQVNSEEAFDGWNSFIVINKAGEQIIPDRYSSIFHGRYNDEPFIWVEKAYDFVDTVSPWGETHTHKAMAGIYAITGKEIIPCKYDSLRVTLTEDTFAGAFDQNAELIRVAGTDRGEYVFGFIDREGNEVIPFMFTDATAMYNGVFFGQMDGKWMLYSAVKSGTLGQKDELTWWINHDTLRVDGPLGAEDMVVAACRDAAGRFIGAAIVRAGQMEAKLPEEYATAKLLWLGAGQVPRCDYVEVDK